MATQEGPIRIMGTIGDLCFYKSGNQYLVREKGGPSSEQFKHAKAFAGSRSMSEEFGHASGAAARIRQTLWVFIGRGNKKQYQQVFKVLRQIIAQDAQHVKGKRTVKQGLHTKAGRELLFALLSELCGDQARCAQERVLEMFGIDMDEAADNQPEKVAGTDSKYEAKERSPRYKRIVNCGTERRVRQIQKGSKIKVQRVQSSKGSRFKVQGSIDK